MKAQLGSYQVNNEWMQETNEQAQSRKDGLVSFPKSKKCHLTSRLTNLEHVTMAVNGMNMQLYNPQNKVQAQI